ncbi:hypothetical protein [Natrinema caseinilyticum]|uniref:hypothetical protein n=1 Tax=Natrinema caseinilyticum TaxID=2961570 RepID=UPI0020C4B6E1|nr:hypothetical protein [Natrinema caseinilyticum]
MGRSQSLPVHDARKTRRRCLSGLTTAAGASLAGCLGDTAENDHHDADGGNGSSSKSDPGKEEQTRSDDVSETPEGTLRQYVEASAEGDDPAAVGTYFHPVHPFHPDNLDAENAEERLLKDDPISVIETEIRDRDVTPETVLSVPILQATSVERDAIADAIDGERTALVDVTVTGENGETTDFNAVTVTADGEWTILAWAVRAGDESTEPSDKSNVPSSFDARVVEDVTFDTEADLARVHFVNSPVADSVTATAENAYSSRSSNTPKPIDYFDLSLSIRKATRCS